MGKAAGIAGGVLLGLLAGLVALVMLVAGAAGQQKAHAADECAPITTPTGKDHPAAAMSFFTGRGLTADQAAGLVGNMQVESGPDLDPRATNPAGYRGIVQWDPLLRWPREQRFAQAIGQNPDALNTQLRYTAWELGLNNEWVGHHAPYQGIGHALQRTHDPAAAAELIFDRYENPGDTSLPSRQSNARAASAKYGDDAPPTPGRHAARQGPPASLAVATSDRCETGPAGAEDVLALQKTLLAYAWHDWQPPGRLPQRPAYTAAITDARRHHRYVAAVATDPPSRPVGDDCGGFVTTFIHDSGWDPTYNHSARLDRGAGNTTTQQQWLETHWKRVGSASSLKVSELRPGDVGISTTGGFAHVWVYVGHVPGFAGTYAEASQGDRSAGGPSAGHAPQAHKAEGVLYAGMGNSTYYRRPHTPHGS